MKNKKLNSNWQDLYSNYVKSNMAVFKMPANSMSSKCKLFCAKIIFNNKISFKYQKAFIA